VTTTINAARGAALHRAKDAFAHALPVTAREHVHHVASVCLWLSDWADELGPAALDDLANRLRPLRKEGTR
jgi:hypothetical protein